MRQFLLEQWICECGFEFYTKGYPYDLIVCPSCEQSNQIDNGRTYKAEQWNGEELR